MILNLLPVVGENEGDYTLIYLDKFNIFFHVKRNYLMNTLLYLGCAYIYIYIYIYIHTHTIIILSHADSTDFPYPLTIRPYHPSLPLGFLDCSTLMCVNLF